MSQVAKCFEVAFVKAAVQGDYGCDDAHITHLAYGGCHQARCKRCPRTVFNKAHNAVLQVLGRNVVQIVVHGREEVAVVCHAAKCQAAQAERLGHGIRHVVTAQVERYHLAGTGLFEHACAVPP